MTVPNHTATRYEAETNPEFAAEQLVDKLGIEITRSENGQLVGTMPVAGNRQPYGLLHGGASAVLAETLGSLASFEAAGPGRIAVGLELSCTHHRAARSGLVTGVASPLHVGRSTATFEIVISDEEGKRVCTARLTCVLRDTPPGG
ncbi:hotdog fold thioesterase [Umezawaea beigongshangensis]|uniref:hotdog fold thioesterase n=1 Tax=Umezawaea beigongshangensis TaxID=2780383 RepID=UPI0018F26A2A|nr:hotdog fold thioesterase [Umezawaea beigongshangensis]